MHVRAKIAVYTLAIGLMAVSHANGQRNTDATRASLRGLKGVYVSIHYDAPPEAKAGLTEKELRDVIQLRLRANGVHLLTKDEWRTTEGEPYLYVDVIGTNLLSSGEKSDLFFYTFSMELMQRVKLERPPYLACDAGTWSQGYSAIVPKRDLRTITVRIGNLAYEFAQAMKAANAM
jgi:hypothetical protein